MNIGSVIMAKRKALGYTQQILADKLNVSFQTVSKWENGKRKKTCRKMQYLCRLFKG
ncbi:XRE family transcriptional regulator [bacterium D16-51]|nr:XRE family transcriptional regulator [bacterium D16-59]RKI61724.1 XRE family transcriptional regulator [bacterium D16-51]